MSTFSTTVTQTQRDAIDFNTRGRAISTCSRQNSKRPGYNRSPFEPKVTEAKPKQWTLGKALQKKVMGPSKQEAKHAKLQVRPNTKRGQRSVAPTSKDIQLPVIPLEKFLETTCELATPRDMFIGIYALSKGKPCIGCAYDVHSKTSCKAKQYLATAGKLTFGKTWGGIEP